MKNLMVAFPYTKFLSGFTREYIYKLIARFISVSFE